MTDTKAADSAAERALMAGREFIKARGYWLESDGLCSADVDAGHADHSERMKAFLAGAAFTSQEAARNEAVGEDMVAVPRRLLQELADQVYLPEATIERLSRDGLGRLVREAWVRWAERHPTPKPHWLVHYDGLDEPDKEVDRQIGVDLARMGASTFVTSNRFLFRKLLEGISVSPDVLDGALPASALSALPQATEVRRELIAKCAAIADMHDHRGDTGNAIRALAAEVE